MNNESLFELFELLRTNDDEIINAASNQLMEFYSTPESLPFLSSTYLTTDDMYLKESIIIGIGKSLNDENVTKLSSEELSILQDNLISMIIRETNEHLLFEIQSFFIPILNKYQMTWKSLDDYIFEGNNENKDEYFFIFSNYINTKTNEDCDYIIEFARPKLKYVFAIDLSINSQLSALCFVLNISFRKGYQDFLWEFIEECQSLFQNVCLDTEHNLLKSFITMLHYAESGLGNSEFTKQICPLRSIINYCLSHNADYSNIINLRAFINESLMVSETDPSDLLDLIQDLIVISKYFYSTEIDVQTQRIDDYFPILKNVPFDKRVDLCTACIEDLIQESTAASICAALSLFRGAIISGVTFDENNLDFLMQCYNSDDVNVQMIAASTLIDVCEELSTEIEENMDDLLSIFCQHLISLFDSPYEIREQIVLSVFEVIRAVISFSNDFLDETCEILIESLTKYIQEGLPIEQYQSLIILMIIIQKTPKIAFNEELYNFIFKLLENQDPSIKELVYGILMIYIELYPQCADIDSILKAISEEPDEECFVYFDIIGKIASRFGSSDEIKEFIISKISLILEISENNLLIESEDHRGSAISSLFYIMGAFTELIPQILQSVIDSITNIISTHGLNDRNVENISKGIEYFASRVDEIDYTIPKEIFEPIFGQITYIYKTNIIVENNNLFTMLFLMTNFVECCEIPSISFYMLIALRRFIDLMKIDEKKDIEEIQSISNFVRIVFENCESGPIEEMGKQLVAVIFEQLTTKQSSSDLECHLILILTVIAANHCECFDEYGVDLMSFLIDKMSDCFPNIAKNIAYFIKNLADSGYLMSFLDDNEEKLHILLDNLGNFLSPPDCQLNTLLRLNDNVISALISIEKELNIMEIDEFYSSISPYLPAVTDDDEFFDIYAPLIDSLDNLNPELQDHFINVLICFFSQRQSAKFFSSISDEKRDDLIITIHNLINEKLKAVDDPQAFVNNILQDDEAHKGTFAYFLNYIGSAAHQLLSQNKEE